MLYVIGVLLTTACVEGLIVWYGMKYGFISTKKIRKDWKDELRKKD